MEAVSRTINAGQDGFRWEALASLISLALGAAGLMLVYDASLWNRLFPVHGQLPQIGEVVWKAGAVRHRQDGSLTWRDVLNSNGVATGDTVFTGEEGSAEIRLENGVIEVQANSLVRIRAPEEYEDQSLWSRWLGAQPLLQFDQGGGKVRLESGEPVRIRVRERSYELKGAEPVEFSVSQTGRLEVVSATGSEAEVRELVSAGTDEQEPVSKPAPVSPARILSPRSGAVIYQPASYLGGLRAPPVVQFRWDSSAQGPGEIVIAQGESTGEATSVSLQTGWAQRLLEPGTYRWRVTGRGWASSWEEFRVVALEAPQLLGPPAGAVIAPLDAASAPIQGQRTMEVALSWQGIPEGFVGEVEISGTTSQVVRGGPFGLRLSLPAGEYTWRVRATGRSETEKALSPWTEGRTFAVSLVRPAPRAMPAPVITPEPVATAEPVKAAPVPAPAEVPALPAPKAHRKAVKIEMLPTLAIAAKPSAKAKAADPTLSADGANASTRLGSTDDLDTLRIALRWKPLEGATGYRVEVRDDSDDEIAQESVREPRKVLTLTSLKTVNYRYRIEATLDDGRKLQSPWSPIRITFSAPVPKLPKDGATQVTGGDVLLTWESTVLTRKYLLQIAPSRSFDRLVSEEKTERNFFLFPSERPGRYYWRVKGVAEGVSSEWSVPSSFEIKPASSSSEVLAK